MIQLNPRYEAIFNPDNIDQDCDEIASLMNVEADFIKEALDAGLYKQGVTMYLQLLKSMCEHFVEDEHYCYFDDMYSPEYTIQWIYEAIQNHDIDAESLALLDEGHKEILQSECLRTMVFLHILNKSYYEQPRTTCFPRWAKNN